MLNIFEDKRTIAGLSNTDNPVKHVLDLAQINHTMYLLNNRGTTCELYPWSASLNDFDRRNKFEIIVHEQEIDHICYVGKRYSVERGIALIKQLLIGRMQPAVAINAAR